MDSKEVAALLGTTTRILRRFLRSPQSTFSAVGSGARYDFNDSDIPTLRKRFIEWSGVKVDPELPAEHVERPTTTQDDRDVQVWSEEGPVVLPDIRDPRILAQVRAAEAERVARLEERLMAAGLHISQWADR